MTKRHSRLLIIIAFAAAAGGCATRQAVEPTGDANEQGLFVAPKSFLVSGADRQLSVDANALVTAGLAQPATSLTSAAARSSELKSLAWAPKRAESGASLRDILSRDKRLTVAAEEMPLNDFIHYVFGELLKVNYVLGGGVGSSSSMAGEQITLSVTDALSERQVFDLVAELLLDKGVQIKFANNTYFFYREGEVGSAPELVIGMGRDKASVPETNQQIMQVIPVEFGIKGSLERTLRTLSGARIVPDFEQSAIFAEGSRSQILKTIELIELLDTPATRGKYIGLVELTYLLPDRFASEVTVLLKNEGISASVREANGMNLVLVPLDQLGAVVVFSSNEFLLERVRYWSSILDAPSEGDSRQYFVYKPKYSRVTDLSKSVGELIGAKIPAETTSTSTGQAPSQMRASSGVVDDIDMVIDARANALIFYCSGIDYRALLPLIKSLDVMPKQVMLDIVIAEVTLKDEFKYGVEWAFRQSEVALTTQGAFGVAGVGGIGLIVNGSKGLIQAASLDSNSLIKVLSNPSLMVRDGTDASISIGSEISVVGQTSQDPISGERQTTSSEYRSTGVQVSVGVAINASGIVVMNIGQSISNTVPGTAGSGGNPDIFTRDIKTEIIAKSGQTVMLGGLISETRSTGGSGTPLLSKIPLLGGLFKAESDGSDRTELVMLVTPRIIEDLSSWEGIMRDFDDSLKYLSLGGESQ